MEEAFCLIFHNNIFPWDGNAVVLLTVYGEQLASRSEWSERHRRIRAEMKFPLILTLDFKGGEWSGSPSGRFTHHGKNPRYVLCKMLHGHQSLSGSLEKRKISSSAEIRTTNLDRLWVFGRRHVQRAVWQGWRRALRLRGVGLSMK